MKQNNDIFSSFELVIWYRNDRNTFELSTNLFIIAWENRNLLHSFYIFLWHSVSLHENIWFLNANREIKTAMPLRFVRIKSIGSDPVLYVQLKWNGYYA